MDRDIESAKKRTLHRAHHASGLKRKKVAGGAACGL